MQIKYTKEPLVKFSTLLEGECFLYENRVLMKISSVETNEEDYYSAVCLEDGNLFNVWDSEEVRPIKAQVEILQ